MGVSMAKLAFEIRMDRNFMTSLFDCGAGLLSPHHFHAPSFTQVAEAQRKSKRARDNDFPSAYFSAAAEVNFVALRRRGGKFYLWNNFY